MEITDVVSKGLNHLEVKYDVPWWDIKKWKFLIMKNYVLIQDYIMRS